MVWASAAPLPSGRKRIQGGDMAWLVQRVEGVNTSSGLDTAEAALVHLVDGEETYRITVELSGSAGAAGQALDPHAVVAPYLNDPQPPRHLIVTTAGVQPVAD
jgi:hypothetical protein